MASFISPRHRGSGLGVAAGTPIDLSGRNSYNKSMKTTVSEKGQVTIPKRLRERLGLRKGTVLEVRAQRGRLVMTKKPSRDAIDELFGILKLGRRTDEIIDEMRGGERPK